MSPGTTKEAIAAVEKDGKVWAVLLKLGLLLTPFAPFVVGLNVWLVSEAFSNRDFRSRGTRFTREEHLEFRAATEARLLRMEQKYDDVYELLIRVDANTQALRSEMERLKKLDQP